MKKRVFLLLVFILCCGDRAFAGDECIYRPSAAQQTESVTQLRRGVNLSGWWQGKRHNNYTNKDFLRIRGFGFDFVRIPVSQEWLYIDGAGRSAETMDRLRCDLIGLLNNGLSVVLDLHVSKNFYEDLDIKSQEDLLSRLEKLWNILGAVAKDLPEEKIHFNLLNEPSKNIRNWWGVQAQLIEKLRLLYPKTTFIVSDNRSGFWGLKDKTPYVDSNIIYDFHFYQPMFFTHHYAKWSGMLPDVREKTDNIVYPSSDENNADQTYEKMVKYKQLKWNKEKLARMLEPLIEWSRRNKARIICLEFGVYRSFVDKDSRSRWHRDVREIFESNNIPWALWEYEGGFGLLDNNGLVDKGVAGALGLNPND